MNEPTARRGAACTCRDETWVYGEQNSHEGTCPLSVMRSGKVIPRSRRPEQIERRPDD